MGESTRVRGGAQNGTKLPSAAAPSRAVVTSRLGFLARIIARFLGDAPDLVSTMQTAAASGDLAAIERAAGLLGASAATVGANQLSCLCAELREPPADTAARSRLIASIAEEHTRVAGILAGLAEHGERSDAPR